jgi:ribosomal protein S18 acetylase RimI-like enzyme
MTDIATIQACEERLVNVWPALQTMLMGDWVLRFAQGYSGRANSASAIRAGADLSPNDLDHLVRLYREAGLAPAIRVTPLCRSDLAQRLTRAGWRPIVTSVGMVAPADPDWWPAASVRLESTPAPEWIAGVTRWQEARKSNAAAFAAILGQIRSPAAFARVEADGVPAGYGMSVCDRDMAEIGSILLGPEFRGKGYGRALVESLIAWARETGAARVFLQVEENNAVAIGLYRSLGFEEVYRYTEYRLAE